ncbi:hypothetical protein [Parendozoicomonas haliclonae]|uniref:Uncharacterized protein n=1 Tax=Parendozoicomonas haliclonae TaxID=1960125 RepID=A0A1X7AK34_9GAMM|nr:hypothetical protein [Parendozoicomonas haliclonae]SMA47381.1 hypothetical protein EHSB41UT_02395 [Parendozoicomonas haliclonae]
MDDTKKIFTTTPATFKAYVVDCGKHDDADSCAITYEPVVAWMHITIPEKYERQEHHCRPITALHGALTEGYALYYPEDDAWQRHSGLYEGHAMTWGKGKTELEKELTDIALGKTNDILTLT